MPIKLSVIIPCYNCAPVIVRCLDSIDYPDAEIIVVNDGSTDNSAEVVEQFIASHKEKNVLLVNKTNGGVSSARNLGIDQANGDFIMFVDADDYVKGGGIERIVDLAETKVADIVLYKANYYSSTDVHINESIEDYPLTVRETSGKEALMRNDVADFVIWLGVFRRSVIVNNNIHFLTDLSLHEDDCFMGMFYCHAEKVVVTDLPLYCYIRASNYSSTHRQSLEKQRSLINSGWKAASYRLEYVAAHYPKATENERLKYMRWVCTPRMAVEAQLTKKDYRGVLDEYRALGVYPLDYKWIKVAGYDYAFKPYAKRAIKSFLINHLWIGWPLAKMFYSKRK